MLPNLILRIVTISYFIDKKTVAHEAVELNHVNNNNVNSVLIGYISTKPLSKLLVKRKKEESNKDLQIPLSKKTNNNLSTFTRGDKFTFSTNKGFSSQEYNIHRDPNHESYQLRPIMQSSTSSFIEFHYMDNFDYNMIGKNISLNRKNQTIGSHVTDSVTYKIAFLYPPYFILRLNGNCKNQNRNKPLSFPKTDRFSNIKDFDKHSDLKMRSYFNSVTNLTDNKITRATKTSSTYKESDSHHILSQKDNKTENIPLKLTKKDLQMPKSTTSYDRIKFFEIYDSDTNSPFTLPYKQNIDSVENNFNQGKINLNDVDNDHFIHSTRYVKKHVSDGYKSTDALTYKRNFATKIMNQNTTAKSTTIHYLSEPALWADFPFVAVYIYEPSQVRCDCAAISSLWLVASATCLHRHHKNVRAEGRSAFIAYCSDNWKRPGRIAYVRRTILHPRFKTNDKIRRQLYNIGVVQVANSMSNTCNGWLPISLMSHQFVADRTGTLATAVGWGLDRYDIAYTDFELPTHTLMLYKTRVHSDSCPGNLDYSKARRLNETSLKNLYCLSLPTYIEEDNDPVHGGLLLVEGKLIALYLQEERRPWGEQSAQYTGIWRLIPWLLDVAREINEQEP